MIIKYNINQIFKLNPRFKIFIISSQSEDLYQHLNRQIRDHFQCEQQISLQLQQADQWVELCHQTQNYDMFASPRAYEIHLAKTALKVKSLPNLQPLAQDIFIFKTQEFKHPLLQQIQNQAHCLWILAYEPSRSDLWRYLQQHLKSYQIAPEIEPWLIQQAQLNFYQCQQLITKIHLGFPQQTTIDLQQVQNLIGYSAPELDWNPLLHAFQKKDPDQCLRYFRAQVVKDHDLILLVWLLHRQVQIFYALLTNIQEKAQIFNQFKCWPKQQEDCIQAMRYFSLSELEQMLIQLKNIDKNLKSGAAQLAKHQLERLFMQASDNVH